MKIEVVAYRKEWVAQFTSERERLKAALPIAFLQIFHIGSTSVKGLVC
ncbi:GrpB family protein [Latilactobacillus sakei]